MDSRTARRGAEKAARELITSRAAVIGELGVAAAERAHLAAAITAAADQGRQLVAAAETEAARLVATARDLAAGGDQRYTDAHTAATAAGWTPADLTALGYPPLQPPARRRRTPSTHASAGEQEPAPQPTTAPGTGTGTGTGTVTVPQQAASSIPDAPAT